MTGGRRILPSTETPELPGPRVSALIGAPGCGKTTFAREAWFTWPRCIAVDSQVRDGRGEYPGLVARNLEELAQLLEKVEPLERFRITYRGPMTVSELDGEEPDYPLFAAAAKIPDLFVLVEEADKVMSKSWTPPGLYAIAHHGRRFGQGMLLCSRRPASIPADLRSTFERLRAWRMDEPLDREWIRAAGFDLAQLDELGQWEALERVRLEDGTSRIEKRGGAFRQEV